MVIYHSKQLICFLREQYFYGISKIILIFIPIWMIWFTRLSRISFVEEGGVIPQHHYLHLLRKRDFIPISVSRDHTPAAINAFPTLIYHLAVERITKIGQL